MLKKHIHYDDDLENAIIGACLIEKLAFSRIFNLLKSAFFRDTLNGVLFSVLQEMYENAIPIDMFTLPVYIAKRNKQLLTEYNIPFEIIEKTKSVVSTAHLEFHSLLIRDMYVKRRMLELQASVISDTPGIDSLEDLKEELEELSNIKTTDDWEDMTELLTKLHQHMDSVLGKDLIGVTTGFNLLDKMTSGFTPGMFVIGARPSVGKSALLNKMVVSAASGGKKVGIINLEMSQAEIAGRLSSLVVDMDFNTIFRNQLRDEQERLKFYSELDTLANLPIKVSSATGVNIQDIRAKTLKLYNSWGCDILFIDYLQLVDTETKNKNYNRENEVAKLSRGLKLLSMDLQIPIVPLCQLNRESVKNGDKKPQLHHLRESGSIEQDADGVMFLHRDWKVGIMQNNDGGSTEREADLIVAKWRNGQTGEIKIGFDPPKMKFLDLEYGGVSAYTPSHSVSNDQPF